MSKKESEFDRYDRMRKMQKEAEVEKRKSFEEGRKRGGRPKVMAYGRNRNICVNFDYDDYDY